MSRINFRCRQSSRLLARPPTRSAAFGHAAGQRVRFLLATMTVGLASTLHAQPTYTRVATEGQSFSVSSPQSVRYGIDGKWIEKTVSGTVACTNRFFDGDPAYGTVKRCEQAGAVALGTGDNTLAFEGQLFTVASPQLVRYGANGAWLERMVSGSGQCSNSFFSGDPIYGTVKHCERVASALAAPAGGMGPYVNVARIPTGSAGHGEDRVMPTSELSKADTSGSFRTVCLFSHMSFDDPIVSPGQKDASHLHAFFGNTAANAFTTAASLVTTGNSTCWGGTINRSSYWQPAIIDTADGSPVKPWLAIVYYKSGWAVTPSLVQPMPAGLRMIAGNPKASAPVQWGPTEYRCTSGKRGSDNNFPDPTGPHSIPDCPGGEDVQAVVKFPQCWDGRNLDSPDHQSHMAYFDIFAVSCPATHPVILPEVTITVFYPVPKTGDPLRWRLASDMYDVRIPAGYSLHADWFNGWKPEFSNAWAKSCVQASRDCSAHLLGDGRMVMAFD